MMSVCDYLSFSQTARGVSRLLLAHKAKALSILGAEIVSEGRLSDVSLLAILYLAITAVSKS